MRFQYVFSEIATGLRRNLTMTVAVVITVSISIALLGTGLLIQAQSDATKGYWYDKVEISVFMCNDYDIGGNCSGAVSESEREEIRNTLEDHPEVADVFHESQDEAYERFTEPLDDPVADVITPDQLQESFRVALVDPDEYDGVVSAVSGLPGVQNVHDQREVLGPLFRLLDWFQVGAIAIAAIQVVAATLLIANTIRLAAYSRRRETGIMRLVGASNFYIQLPFILEAAIAGLIGSVFGCVAVFALQEVAVNQLLAPNFTFTAWVDRGDVWMMVPWLLLTGVLISALASFITLRRYLRV
ncbi:ABC transporter permease [Actinobacteria bacterium YIM 96077]|uniref:Cell division protein FtsX n=1 Tax=Phytoactinopolyspora halophila TaxID=1981511 RepID=A0A329R1Y5_9ACTN|nr:permease-like cell division protein FtsX [Phytoactinopolyspora halophila]AYY12090.1 ABC transporter permease [Actinobacteria bacterium YIM 96077]RAW18674.1 ABC transporter permease [Phytoactinopolyspora halophila]